MLLTTKVHNLWISWNHTLVLYSLSITTASRLHDRRTFNKINNTRLCFWTKCIKQSLRTPLHMQCTILKLTFISKSLVTLLCGQQLSKLTADLQHRQWSLCFMSITWEFITAAKVPVISLSSSTAAHVNFWSVFTSQLQISFWSEICNIYHTML